jgi:hypothetical protein
MQSKDKADERCSSSGRRPARCRRQLMAAARGRSAGCSSSSCAAPTTAATCWCRYRQRLLLRRCAPNIAIAQARRRPNGALPLDANWGLHPALRDSVYPLYTAEARRPSSPSPAPTTSRAATSKRRTASSWARLDKGRDYRSGFLNRLAGVLGAGPRRVAHRLHRPAAADRCAAPAKAANMALRRCGSGIDARGRARSSRPCTATPRSRSRWPRLSGARRSHARGCRRDGRRQPQRHDRQGLRAGGAPHRAADARPLRPRLRRRRRLGHPRGPGRGHRLPGQPLSKNWAAAWPASRRRWARRLEGHGGRRHQRVRPHLPRERQPRHRPWPRHGVLGAGRRRRRRRVGALASSKCGEQVPGADRAVFGGLFRQPRCSRTATTRCSTNTGRACSVGAVQRRMYGLAIAQRSSPVNNSRESFCSQEHLSVRRQTPTSFSRSWPRPTARQDRGAASSLSVGNLSMLRRGWGTWRLLVCCCWRERIQMLQLP